MEAILEQPLGARSEASLAKRFRDGDSTAFDEIVRRHRRVVYAVARRLLRTHEDADEAAQVAFVKAWNARERFRGDAQLRTWLLRIALNVSKSMLASARATGPPADERDMSDGATDPGIRIDRHRRRHQLRRAVETLPPRQREVVLLKVYEDLTYREVADVLELTEGAVKAHLHQAVSNLRRGMIENQKEKA